MAMRPELEATGPDLPTAREIDLLLDWTRRQVADAGAKGGVVAISGGIDSAVVAHLLARALPGRALGVLMPCHSQPEDLEDGLLVCRSAGIEAVTVNLDRAYDTLLATLSESGEGTAVAVANVKPRLRMNAIYYQAACRDAVVFGTGNRSELEVGYFTKYGDGGVDFLPLGGYLKHEVRRLARLLEVPEQIITRTPSAGLWAGQTDEGEMGISYEQLDAFLATGAGGVELAERIEGMRRRARHKLSMPPVFPRPGQQR